MIKLKILVIEDDELSRINMSSTLEGWGEVVLCENSEEARRTLDEMAFDIAFIDLDLEKELVGLELVPLVVKKGAYAVVLSGREDDVNIEKAYEKGCSDYLCKPYTRDLLQAIMKKFKLSVMGDSLKNFFRDQFITQDTKLISNLSFIKECIITKKPVLLLGETGTGKSLFASLLHQLLVEDKDKKFVSLNCSAIPENLLESELFGHKKGAFSGADTDKEGLLKSADGGTLFLDEIATMPLDIQKKLLKTIEEKSFYPLGSTEKEKSEFNLISATCEDLDQLIADGKFRQDLYFRILGYRIHLPSLRERKNDISFLIRHFLKTAKRKIVLKEDAKDALLNYSWPGNIRELKNLLDLLVGKTGGIISSKDLPSEVFAKREIAVGEAIDYDYIQRIGLKIYIEQVEEKILKHFLEQNENKVRKTLTDLKISNSSFYRISERMKENYE